MKFDYGDEVVLRTQDASGQVVAKACAVVGITTVESTAQSAALDYPSGTVLYTVEFDDGSDLLVPEGRLERLDG